MKPEQDQVKCPHCAAMLKRPSNVRASRTSSQEADRGKSVAFVWAVLKQGHRLCGEVRDAVEMTSGGKVFFPVTDLSSLEVAVAILGATIGGLSHSTFMSPDRVANIDRWCKLFIRDELAGPDPLPAGFPGGGEVITRLLDEYEAAFRKAMESDVNPFREVAAMMLMHCLGPKVKDLCVHGTRYLGPFTQIVVGDLLTMAVTNAMAFWRGASQ